MKSRIQGTDSIIDIVSKMSEGNPGAMNVCVQIIKEGGAIDPDNIGGGLGALFLLDTLEIYGCKIYMLHNDVCNRNLPKTIALLRANQLGMITVYQLKHAIENWSEGLDVDDLCSKVKERLPKFQLEPLTT